MDYAEAYRRKRGRALVSASDLEDARETLEAVEPRVYEYRPGMGPPGERVGVVAQELEETPMGERMVVEGKRGKMVYGDPGALTALMAALYQRLEKSKEKRNG